MLMSNYLIALFMKISEIVYLIICIYALTVQLNKLKATGQNFN